MRICDDAYEIAKVAAGELVRRSHEALEKEKRCNVALSGGTTPKFLFDHLVNDAMANAETLVLLQNVNWFFSDERFVPPSDAQSNYYLAQNSLFSKLDIDVGAIYAVPTQNRSPEQSARDYQDTIQQIISTNESEIPSFNLIFLGMGDDGHTASLFPGTELVNSLVDEETGSESLVASLWVEKARMHRITFMPSLINSAEVVIVMASGNQKAKTLETVISGLHDPRRFPVQLVKPTHGELIWLVDHAAAQYLNI